MSTVYFLAVSYKLLPEQGNTLANVVCCTINFDSLAVLLRGRNGVTTCKGVYQVSPPPPNHEDTQRATSKVYSRLNFNGLGQIVPSVKNSLTTLI